MSLYPITLTVNGETSTLEVPANRTLLALLKDQLHITSPKEGCGIGECGACTVVMNGEPVQACLVLAVEADGARIETTEGDVHADGTLSALQRAFVDHGAIQCGFCTPGMINSARALLARHPKATRNQIIEGIAGNYCRCTGYEAIIDAISAVVKDGDAYQSRTPEAAPYVGKSLPRIDGVDKVTGTALFVHDMTLPRMLYARMKVSPVASARIVRIDTTKARAMPGVKAVLTGADAPYKVGLYMVDKDVLARDIVRYHGEPVAAVAAETVEQAKAAIEAIEVEYEALPAVLDVHQSLKEDAPLVHPKLGEYDWMKGVFWPEPGRNIAHRQKIRKGDLEQGFAQADRIFEFSFENPQVQHVPMETHTAIVTAKPGGDVDIITSAQSPFTVRHLFCHTFKLPANQVRVRVPYVGGGFGGKAGIHLEPLIYLLSKAAGGRPVKLTATREEEFSTLPCRQGLVSHYKTGVKADGTITAQEITYLWDAGAYADYGVNIGRAAAYAGAGPYCVPNCKLDSLVLYTNKVFGTAYRGFGHLEVHWGVERNLDLIARALDLDPLEIRRRNLLTPGDTTITGEKVGDSHGSPRACLEAVAESVGWERPVFPERIIGAGNGKRRAKGIAMLQKAPAMPSYTACAATLHFASDGSATLQISGVDYGQGTYTMLAQVAADELRLPQHMVKVAWDCDTDFTPYDWQTVASRFAVMGANATIDAARDALLQIRTTAGCVLHAPPEMIECENAECYVRGRPDTRIPYSKLVLGYSFPNGNGVGGPVIGRGKFIAQGLTNLNPETGEGLPALNWTYGAHAVDIEVDTDTGHIEVLHIASAFDVGKVLHFQQCLGQVVGGVVQGIGSALNEKFVFDKGRFVNNSFVDYKIPTAKDIPTKATQIFIETPHPQGPYGARGVGEHPMISIPSAIGNALAVATGVEFFHLPLDPERVYLTLKAAAKEDEK